MFIKMSLFKKKIPTKNDGRKTWKRYAVGWGDGKTDPPETQTY